VDPGSDPDPPTGPGAIDQDQGQPDEPRAKVKLDQSRRALAGRRSQPADLEDSRG
jgi:hypothetical protein